jgi:hypothetical protein
VLGVQRDRVWNSVTRRALQIVRGSASPASRRGVFGDAVVGLCIVAILGATVLGGVLMLFSWVTVMLPSRPAIACPEFDGCPMPTPHEDQAGWVDNPGIDAPKLTP